MPLPPAFVIYPWNNRCLLHGVVHLRHFHISGAHELAGVTHNIGILIDQEHVVLLDAGVGVGVAGAVPGGLGRVLRQ